MPGSRSDYSHVLTLLTGYSAAAVTAAQTLLECAVPFPCRIGGIVARAEGAGGGAGSTVLDVQINGASAWSTAGNRPTLASASTGEFTNTVPEARALRPITPAMDRIRLAVISVPAGSGHTRVSLAVTLERPDLVPNTVRR